MLKYFFNTIGIGFGIVTSLLFYDACVDEYLKYLDKKGE